MSMRIWVKTIYLYLFSLVGLVLLIIGTVGFLDMGLKAFVFTEAEEQQRIYEMKPPTLRGVTVEDVEQIKEAEALSEEQERSIESWLANYKQWEQRQEETDLITSRRHEQAAHNLALIIVGLPLFLYHWRTIRREE